MHSIDMHSIGRQRSSLIAVAAVALVLLAVALFVALPAFAQTSVTPEQVNAVAKELWCPLCNGVRLDNCDLQACVQMREVIAQKLATGDSPDAIKAYFVQQYGEVVLGQPASPLPYILPPLIGIVALGWVAYFVTVWVRRRPAATASQPVAKASRTAASNDEYLERVDEELKNYE